MKLAAESWPETQSVFEFANHITLTSESKDDARVLGLIATILRHGVPEGFEKMLSDFQQKQPTD